MNNPSLVVNSMLTVLAQSLLPSSTVNQQVKSFEEFRLIDSRSSLATSRRFTSSSHLNEQTKISFQQ